MRTNSVREFFKAPPKVQAATAILAASGAGDRSIGRRSSRLPCGVSFVNFRGKVVDSNLALLNQTLRIAAPILVGQLS
jgi:hypothetical protein